MSKVLFIITQSEIGGAQRYLLELAPYLVSRGYEIAVIAGEGDNELFTRLHETSNLKPETYYYAPNLVRNLNPIKDVIALFFLFKIIKKVKPEILFLQSTKAGFLGSLAAKIYKMYCFMFSPCGRSPVGGHASCFMRVVYRIGGWSFSDPRPWWMNKILFWMEKVSANWKDIIIVNSEYDRELALEKRIAQTEKIIKIYNGIDTNNLTFLSKEEARQSLPRPKGAGEIAYVGTIANLYATKGIEYLIEAARILYTKYNAQNTIYVVIGEGKERPKLESLIKKYNLENTFFLAGRMSNASRYLKAFDLFVLPSVKEGFPWVLLEAMATEVPIIATKVGAVPEIIENGKDGLLIVPRDSKALAQKICQLLSIPSDCDRNQMVMNAKNKLSRFSLLKMLEESEGAVQRAVIRQNIKT